MNKEFPENWKSFDLKDICFFQEGPGLRNWQYREKGTKFINIRCIKNGYLDTSIAQCISSDEVENKYNHFLLNEGDYILSSSGTIGRIAVVRKCDLPLLLNTSVIRFRTLDESKLDMKYLFYFLQSKQFYEKIFEQSQGSAQVNFGPSHLKLLHASFPPLLEQKRIAEILSGIDRLIDKNKLKLNQVKKLKESITNDLLDKGIDNLNFIDSELGKIPKGWVIKTISEICEKVKPGPFGSAITKSMYVKDGFKVYGQEQVISGEISKGNYYIPKNKYEELKAFSIKSHDLLISLVGTIGKTLLVPEKFIPGVINPRLIFLRLNNLCEPRFLQYLLSSSLIQQQLMSTQQGGTMGVLSASILKPLKLKIPPIDEQQKIIDVLSSIDSNLEKLHQQLSKLLIIQTSLAQDLLSGRKSVQV